jgi:hypothetical protein
VDAETVLDVTESYPVTSVPTFMFFKSGKILETIQGANPPLLAQKVEVS